MHVPATLEEEGDRVGHNYIPIKTLCHSHLSLFYNSLEMSLGISTFPIYHINVKFHAHF